MTSSSGISVSFGGLEVQQKRLLHKGFPADVVETMRAAVREQSANVYEKSWEKIVHWCSTRGTDFIRAPLREILAFPQSNDQWVCM